MPDQNLQINIDVLEKKIKELEDRLPAHSIPALMLQELEDMEEELESIKLKEGV